VADVENGIQIANLFDCLTECVALGDHIYKIQDGKPVLSCKSKMMSRTSWNPPWLPSTVLPASSLPRLRVLR
jgi:hypothetical protein